MPASSEPVPGESVFDRQCRLTRTLRFGVAACFAGWAWQHLRWSVPYDAILWNPDHAGWVAGLLGVSWEIYVAEVVTDRRILFFGRAVGLVLAASAVVAVTARRDSLGQLTCLGVGGAVLTLASGCLYLDAGRVLATFVEHGGQMLSPVVLILALWRGPRDRWTVGVAVLAFWSTFAGHGTFAVGWTPTPGDFYGLVTGILGLGENAADIFLKTVGVFDFAVCVGVLVPCLRCSCLAYAAVWGLLTALARPVAGMSFGASWWGADQFLHEAVLRAPHVSLPLFLLLVAVDPPEAPPPARDFGVGASA